MAKVEIDYSNTIIYKITCKNAVINDVYVGHTTNFVQRKQAHKYSCINTKSYSYASKLYETIRNNGGWDNWVMEIINFYNCANQYEARAKEQEYFISLNATLNSIEPLPFKQAKVATANVNCSKSHLFDVGNQSNKNNSKIGNEMIPQLPKKNGLFECTICDYNTLRKNDYNKHVLTSKHLCSIKQYTTINELSQPSIISYTCKCGKEYKHDSSYYRHKKNCKKCLPVAENVIISEQNEVILSIPHANDNSALIMELLKQNNEFKALIIEQNKHMLELINKSNFAV